MSGPRLTRAQLELLRSLRASPYLPSGARVATVRILLDAGHLVRRVVDGQVRFYLTASGADRLAEWR